MLPPRRLDFDAMMDHSFFHTKCSLGDYRYKLLFEAGDNAPRYVCLPASYLLNVSRHGWSFSQDILDEYLRPAFPVNPVTQEEEHAEESSAPPPFTYTGEPSLFNYGEGSSSQQLSMDRLSLQQATWDSHLTPYQQYQYMQQQPPSDRKSVV